MNVSTTVTAASAPVRVSEVDTARTDSSRWWGREAARWDNIAARAQIAGDHLLHEEAVVRAGQARRNAKVSRIQEWWDTLPF